MTLTATVPFECSPHVNPRDCHLSVQLIIADPQSDGEESEKEVREDETTARSATTSSYRPAPLALSQCHLSMEGQTTQHILAIPVVDFIHPASSSGGRFNVTVQLAVSSYGDAWWHGYQLPNLTVEVPLWLMTLFNQNVIILVFPDQRRASYSVLCIHARSCCRRD